MDDSWKAKRRTWADVLRERAQGGSPRPLVLFLTLDQLRRLGPPEIAEEAERVMDAVRR